jgi:hypothetical protein
MVLSSGDGGIEEITRETARSASFTSSAARRNQEITG